jgi:hypothetical protein
MFQLRYLLFQSLLSLAFSPKRLPLCHRKVSFGQSIDQPIPVSTCEATRNGCLPSDPDSVARLLQDKKVNFRATTERVPPRPFEVVWDALRETLRSSTDNLDQVELISAESALSKLMKPMTETFTNETEFDKALFEALRDCLSAYVLPRKPGKKKNETTIVLNLGGSSKYAVGIARQKSPARSNLLQDDGLRGNIDQNRCTSTGMGINAKPDHAVCLLQKRNSQWAATDCFSVVELKMNDTTCEDFEDVEGTLDESELWDKHSAFRQVVFYNLGGVVPPRAKRGVLGDHIPLALIAGKRNASKTRPIPQKQGLRWVSGRLEVPEACGDVYKYSLQDFGKFSSVDNDVTDVKQALSVYVDTVLFGLVPAIDVWKKLASDEVPLAVPASGQSLMIGHVKANLQFWANSTRGTITSEEQKQIDWAVSQGDLFWGEMDVSKVLRKSGALFVNFRRSSNKKTGACHVVVKFSSTAHRLSNLLKKAGAMFVNFRRGNNRKGACHVVVKVSSIVVHDLYISPDKAFEALNTINGVVGKSLANEIGSVLYAVVETKSGVMTIMDDMTEQGYGSLKPVEGRGQIAALWDGFKDLVEKVLLPMAELGIVHAGIQPGYDITSSIICKLERREDGRVEKATMKLIDFESLVNFKIWDAGYSDGRYVRKEYDWDAKTYLWWQCMAVAYTWRETLSADSLRTDRTLKKMKMALLNGSSGPVWLDQFRDHVKGKTSAETLQVMLNIHSRDFWMSSQ